MAPKALVSLPFPRVGDGGEGLSPLPLLCHSKSSPRPEAKPFTPSLQLGAQATNLQPQAQGGLPCPRGQAWGATTTRSEEAHSGCPAHCSLAPWAPEKQSQGHPSSTKLC